MILTGQGWETLVIGPSALGGWAGEVGQKKLRREKMMKIRMMVLAILMAVPVYAQVNTNRPPVIIGRNIIPRLISDTIFVDGLNVADLIRIIPGVADTARQAADTAAAAMNRITQQGNVSVLEFGATGEGVANDSLPFANAIASVVSGGTLVVPAGTYSTGQINITKALTLELKTGAIIKARDNLNTSLILVEADNVTITGGTIDGNRVNQDPDTTDHTSYDTENFTHGIKVLYDTSAGGLGRKNFKLLNTTIKNTWDVALYIRGKWYEATDVVGDTAITGVEVKGCTFDSTGSGSILFRDVKDVQFTGNTISNWDIFQLDTLHTVNGITFFSSNYINVNISNNIFKPTSVCTSFGVEVTGRPIQRGFIFSNNVLDGLSTGISGVFTNAVFSGNTFTNGGGNHRSGFELVGSDIVVTGNKISNGSMSIGGGYYGMKNIIIGNNLITASDTASAGIGIASGDTPDSNIVIRGNTLDVSNSTNGYGIYFPACIPQTLSISENLIVGNSTTTGIRLIGRTGTTDINILQNRVKGCLVGIAFDSTGLDGAVVTVERNDFRDNTTPITKADVYGSYIFKDNYPTYVNDATTTFVPTSIDSLKAWYTGASANYGYYAPDSLTSWTDLSGEDYHLEGAGLFSQDQVNGLPAILHPSQTHTVTAYQSTTDFTAFVVAKNLSEGGSIFGNAFLGDSISSLMFIGGKLAYVSTVAGVGDTVLASATTISSSTYGIYEWHRSGNTVSMFENGVLSGDGTTNSRPFGFERMANLDSTYIAEVLVYTEALSDSQRFLVENYLNDKYSLTTNYIGNLTTTGTVKTDSVYAEKYGNLPAGSDTVRASFYADSLRGNSTGTGVVVRKDAPAFTGVTTFAGRVDLNGAARLPDGYGLDWGSSSYMIYGGPTYGVVLSGNIGTLTLSKTTGDGIFSHRIRTTPYNAALTDGAPTATEINTATGSTPAGVGTGWEAWFKDTDGTSLMYRVVSDGTSWWTDPMTVAP